MKSFLLYCSLLLLCFLGYSGSILANQYIWKAASGNSGKNKQNWRTTCNVAGTVFPTSNDTLLFNGNCSSANCTLDTTFNVKMIDVRSTYSGTISTSTGITLTFDEGKFKGGTFTGGSIPITFNVELEINGCTFTATSGVMTIIGELTYKGSSFAHNNGTVIFKRASSTTTTILGTSNGSTTLTLYKAEFAAATQNTQYNIRNITMVVENELKTSGTYQLFLNSNASSVVECRGNINITNTSTTGGGTVVLLINGTGSQTLAGNQGLVDAGKLPDVTINKASGTLSLSGILNMGGSTVLTYTAGTVSEGTAKVISTYNGTINNNSGGTMQFHTLAFYGRGDNHTVTGKVKVTDSLITALSGDCIINGDTLEAQGKIVWNNISSGSGGTVTYKLTGSSAQVISGTAALPLYDVIVSKTSGDITLQKEVKINHNIKFITGYIVSDATNLLTIKHGATVSNVSSGSFVKGPVKKIGNASFTFPVGKGSNYNAIEISDASGSSSTDAYTAEYFNSNQSHGTAKDSLTYLSNCEYWNLDRTTGSSNVKVTLHWNSNSCAIYTLTTLRVARWDGSKWNNLGPVTTSGNTTTGSVQTNSNQSSFGDFIISKRSPAVYAFAGDDTSLCEALITTLGDSPSGSGGIPSLTYSWSPSTGLNSSTTANPVFTTDSTHTFVLTVMDLDHTIVMDTVTVTVWPKPHADAGSDHFMCYGYTATIGGDFITLGGTNPVEIWWLQDGDTLSDIPHPSIKALETLDYILYAGDYHSCRDTDTVSVIVNPELIVHAGDDKILGIGETVLLGDTPTISGGLAPYYFYWYPPNDLTDEETENPTFSGLISKSYIIIVTDSMGCGENDEVIVTIQPPQKGESAQFGLLSGDTARAIHASSVTGKAGSGRHVTASVDASDGTEIDNTESDNALGDVARLIGEFNDLDYSIISGDLDDFSSGTGVYRINGSATLSHELTLTGDGSSYYIFIVRDSLILNDSAEIVLDGLEPGQIFFKVGETIRVNGNPTMQGTLVGEGDCKGDTLQGNCSLLLKTGSSIDLEKLEVHSVQNYVMKICCPIFPELSNVTHDLDLNNDGKQDFFGYNVDNSRGARASSGPKDKFLGGWNSSDLRDKLPQLNGTMFRWHHSGGQWDWNKGYHFEEEILQYSDLLYTPHDVDLSCIEIATANKDADKVSNRLTDVNFSLKGQDAEFLFHMPMNGSNYAYKKLWLNQALDLKIPVEYIELGEEPYKGGFKSSCAYDNAQSFLTVINKHLDSLHLNYPDAHITVPVSSPGLDDPDLIGDKCREVTWNAGLGLPVYANDTSHLHLVPGDALSFHLYPTSGLGEIAPNTMIPDYNTLDNMMQRPFKVVDHFKNNEVKAVPVGIDAYITEYGMTDEDVAIHGTWAHGLFVATFTLAMLEVPEIKKLYQQTILQDASHGCFFGVKNGFLIDGATNAVAQLESKIWHLSAQGIASGMIGEAMREATYATKINFPGASDFTGSSYSKIYGWMFESDTLDFAKQGVIVNLSDTIVEVSRIPLIPGDCGYESIYPGYTPLPSDINNPLVYILGDNGSSRATYDNGNFLETNLNDPENPALTVEQPHNAPPVLKLMPYSITRIYEIKPNITIVNHSNIDPCEADFGSGSGDPLTGVAINLRAQGSSDYTWKVVSGGGTLSDKTKNSVMLWSRLDNSVTVRLTNSVGDTDQIVIGIIPEMSTLINATGGTEYVVNISSCTVPNLSSSQPSLSNWWSPTIGLYDQSSGGSNVIQGTIYTRPNEDVEYLLTSIDTATGCFALATQQITAKAIPNIKFKIFSSGDGCSGDTVTLTTEADSFKWYYRVLDDATFKHLSSLNNVDSIKVVPLRSVQYKLEVTGLTCQLSAYKTIFVSPELILDYNKTSICLEEPLTIEVSGAEGDSAGVTYTGNYFWSPTGMDLNNDSTKATFDTNSAGTYNIIVEGYYDDSVNSSIYKCTNPTKDTVQIVVAGTEPSVNVGSDIIIPLGCTVDLDASIGSVFPDVYYSWSPGNYLSSVTGNQVTYAPTTTGTDTLMVTAMNTLQNSSGCCGNDTIIITVNPVEIYCTSQGHYLCNLASNPLISSEYTYTSPTYHWFKNGSSIPTITGQSFYPDDAGTYTLQIDVLGYGSSVISNEVVIYCIDDCLKMSSASSINSNQILIYPNPTSNSINVQAVFESDDQEAKWQLLNSYGQIIQNGEVEIFDQNINFNINLEHFEDGIYWLRLFTQDQSLSTLVILNR